MTYLLLPLTVLVQYGIVDIAALMSIIFKYYVHFLIIMYIFDKHFLSMIHVHVCVYLSVVGYVDPLALNHHHISLINTLVATRHVRVHVQGNSKQSIR